MARDLTPIRIDLLVSLDAYRRRNEGEELHDFAAAELTPSTVVIETAIDSRGGQWKDAAGASHASRARLVVDGSGDFATSDTSRRVRTPVLAASKARSWDALELLYAEDGADPDSPTATVRYRLYDGTDELWWNGAAWAVYSIDVTHRNTAKEVMDNFASLAAIVRELAVVAFLDTTDKRYSPYFFGARVLFGVSIFGCDDDALLRTFLQRIRDELTVTGWHKFTTAAIVSTIAIPTAEIDGVTTVSSVDAVYNLTDDPSELTPLTGTLLAGAWTPDTPIASGKLVHLEYTHSPDLVIVRHRDATKLRRLPSIVFESTSSSMDRGESPAVVRNILATLPAALEIAPPDLKTVDLAVRIVAEFSRDLTALERAWRSFFNGSSYRLLLSPQTGRAVSVHMIGEMEDVSGALSLGVVEARGTVRLSYSVARRDTTVARPLVRTGGVTFTTSSERF